MGRGRGLKRADLSEQDGTAHLNLLYTPCVSVFAGVARSLAQAATYATPAGRLPRQMIRPLGIRPPRQGYGMHEGLPDPSPSPVSA